MVVLPMALQLFLDGVQKLNALMVASGFILSLSLKIQLLNVDLKVFQFIF
jgi:hypothetical protein